MSFKQLREEVLDNIKEALSCYDIKDTDEATEYKEDIDFWFDPEIVLYNSELASDEIEAASYADIDPSDEYLGIFLSEDICKTYLSTRDFALIVGVEEADEMSIVIGVIDRSTGVAMLNDSDLLDSEALADAARIAIENSSGKKDLKPIQRKYQRITADDTGLSEVQLANSQRRLTALLSEIDQQVLSRFMGKQVIAKEEL